MPIASVLSGDPRWTGLMRATEEVLESLPLQNVLVYYTDTVSEKILDELAIQFDMLDYKGWAFADTIEKKRELIRFAIELRQKKGTPWSIKKALSIAGFDNIEIQKASGILYDGTTVYNGNENYGSGFWANFLVKITMPTGYSVNVSDIQLVTKIVNQYKPHRSVLIGINWLIE